jgi:hypothetical protein
MFLIPGQQVRTASRRRLFGAEEWTDEQVAENLRVSELARQFIARNKKEAAERPARKAREDAERRAQVDVNVAARLAKEGTREDMPYGPWIQPFGGCVYSYPTDDPQGTNFSKRFAATGWFACCMLAVGILSYSWVDALILHATAFGVEELFEYNLRHGNWPWWQWHGPGKGISGVMGWQAGYLLTQMLFKGWNWLSLGGVFVLVGYIVMYLQGKEAIGHAAHFGGIAAGFVTGIGLKWYGPKQRPVAFLAKHSGKATAGIVGAATLLKFYTKNIWPDPPGYKAPFR